MTGPVRKILAAFGLVAMIVSFWFLYGQVERYGALLPDGTLLLGNIGTLAILAFGYMGALCLLAEVWYLILKGLSTERPAERAHAYVSFLSSQIVKYLPTGIFHLVGRFGWLVARGYNKAAVGKATGVELGLMLLLASALSLVGVILEPPAAGVFSGMLASIGIAPVPLWLMVTVAGTVAGIGWLVFQRYFLDGVKSISPFALVAGLLFFGLQAAVFAGCYHLVAGALQFGILPLFTLSWLLGFVAVSAPGGFGVREAAFIVLTTGLIEPDLALYSVVLFRLVTLGGELVAFGAGYAINVAQKNQLT